MGNFFEKEKDPLEAEFFGMSFYCNKEYFVAAAREEFEIIFLVPYLVLWF